jgi:hypothetical protein
VDFTVNHASVEAGAAPVPSDEWGQANSFEDSTPF